MAFVSGRPRADVEMRLDGTARVSAPLRARLRTIPAVLATVLRLPAAVMPLAMVPVPPAVVDDGYARFVATFGPDASVAATAFLPVPDCAVCPLCVSLRDGAWLFIANHQSITQT
jgi:hypothetical protein